jgi:hypothetical protein
MDTARDRAQRRRERAAEAQRTYETFLTEVATPVVRQLANAMKAEGYAFTVFTPGAGLRLASDRAREDFIELSLDTSGDRPEVVGRVSHQRGSRTIDREAPLKRGAGPEEIGEDDVLEFFIGGLEPWLER